VFEAVVQIAQISLVVGIAAWLSTGVYDNIAYPENNEDFTAEVMSMTRMRNEYPEHFARVSHRAITRRGTQKLAFRIVVLAELAACLVLWAGVGALTLALFGATDANGARALALLGATLFTSVWAGFLIVGNYFCYWFCHEGAQNTHYQMTLWGIAAMIFLATTG
jgi:predicted small integral membrane protein